MPAPLTEQRMKEIARVVASSPTMAGAAVTLGYSSRESLASVISRTAPLKRAVRDARRGVDNGARGR